MSESPGGAADDISEFEIIENYLKLSKVTPVGTFELKSTKAFWYIEDLKKLEMKAR